MRVECECGKPLKVPDNLIGKRVRCPECGSTLLVEVQRGAIAVGRPKQAVTVADDTPPPRKRRPLVEEAPAPRKRARAEDFDEEQDDRPRRKKKTQQSGGLPLLLILGGVAAIGLFLILVGGGVGAYFLFFRKGSDAPGMPTTRAGSKNKGFGDTNPLAANTAVVREALGKGTVNYSIKGGGLLSADAQLALMEVFGKGGTEEKL
jgi:DNA-directed RNA polymerase subunit RPC12/RpoP